LYRDGWLNAFIGPRTCQLDILAPNAETLLTPSTGGGTMEAV